MRAYLRWWHDRSIRFKLNCIFLLIILISLLTLSFWGIRTYSSYSENQADQSTLQMIHQVESNVDYYIEHLKDVQHYISQDPEVEKFMQMKGQEPSKDEVARIDKTLTMYTERNKEIMGIMLVNKSGSFTSHDMFRITRDSLVEESWFQDALKAPNDTMIISNPIGRNVSTSQNYSSYDVLSLVHAVVDPQTEEVLGVVLMDLRMDMIKSIFENVKLGKSGFMYILDHKGNIVYAPTNDIVYRIQSKWLPDGSQGSLTQQIKGHDYRILFNDSATNKWRFIGVIPNDDYQRVITDIQLYTLIVTFITIVLASLLSAYFTGTLIRPIRKLMSLMSHVKNGELNQRFVSETKDEIGQLGNSFNHMLEEINNLINVVYAEQKKKREAELQVLQAQIKPHFLYNTLDTIQWMAQEYEADDIIEVIGALTNLFRIGLNRGNEWIPVRDEVKHAESYMIIQMSRYMDKLDFKFDIPEHLYSYQVLKLILQPLIENAIYHGIKARTGKGKISICAELESDLICFRITDDGAGIPPEKLEEINQILRGEKMREDQYGIGLFNVNERIQLTYGTAYGIQIYSALGKGTTVEIKHPMVQAVKKTG
ncbi:sensor histidine kinase [Paenibacillus sp. CGMCC 1.16610]|uniref:histidine kinase n=1 Tax=Paenibacillus anseongense TaxID=2682845 RepID=A0ABW9UKQ5_9BACL|nr:sensor histidine kinase [Paenibacillus sp. CGMCC 1.16610]MBA2936750.1 sensor histidine kinase [Paenibacillus sp. CGMCC 1.16610]MVQ39743.1 HAMP domain-containing protein [Paenibacillus anseongense]